LCRGKHRCARCETIVDEDDVPAFEFRVGPVEPVGLFTPAQFCQFPARDPLYGLLIEAAHRCDNLVIDYPDTA
jgi:hypothetical protein